jgi:hypothetical protein
MNLKLLMLGVILCGCASRSQNASGPEAAPAPLAENRGDAVAQILAKFKERHSVAPQAIYGYQYDGRQVFLVIAPCCDQFNPLFDADGSEICAPTGGFAGNGDGSCPDFESRRKDETLLWKP